MTRFDEVITVTARYFDVAGERLLTSQRSRHVVHPRHVAMAVLVRAGWTKARVAERFGMDYSTVRDGCAHVQGDINLRLAADAIEKELAKI